MDKDKAKRLLIKITTIITGTICVLFFLMTLFLLIGIIATKDRGLVAPSIFCAVCSIIFLFPTLGGRRKLKKTGIADVEAKPPTKEPIKNSSTVKEGAKVGKCKNCSKFTFKLNENGLCNQCQIADLQAKVAELTCPEYQDLTFIREQIETANSTLSSLNKKISDNQGVSSSLEREIEDKRKEIINLNNIAEMQEYGIYEPTYEFLKVEEYKFRLIQIREQQKAMVRDKSAVTGLTNWTVNNSLAQGKKMVADTQKLLLRAFNGECDELVAKVKYNNLDATIKRINASCEAISKLGKIMQISIRPSYKNLKIEEVKLAYEYAQAKQKEKEELKAYREQMREEAKLQREIEEQRKKILKEQTHYANAIAKLRMQISEHPDDEDLKAKLAELTEQYNETEKAMQDIDYREANKRAGYVYVISNIGSFGENVFKIGMTRRLDPQDRVDELGDASVPFNFDVHAMIFTEDAPKLEAALHNAFEDRKLNLVNHRREFFNVTLDEIKRVVKENYDKTVEFVDVPDAEQYRMSKNFKKAQAEK